MYGVRDMFSVLPDQLIHEHIFPLLGMNEIIRIRILSKKFLQLSVSSPYLYIDSTIPRSELKVRRKYNQSWNTPYQTPESDLNAQREYNQFCTAMDRYFDENQTITSLRLHWKCRIPRQTAAKFSRVCCWIEKAIALGNLRELDLHLSDHSSYEREEVEFKVPNCVLTSQTLKVLKLKIAQGHVCWPASLHSLVPSSIEVLALEDLSLKGSVDDFDFLGQWISALCPSLKKLLVGSMRWVTHLNITSSSLEDLSVFIRSYGQIEVSHLNISAENLQVLNLDIPTSAQRETFSVKIFAPNLKTLSWKAYVQNYSHSGNFSCLQHSSVTNVDPHLYYHRTANSSGLPDLLCSLSSTRGLEIDGLLINKLFGDECSSSNTCFENLHHLVLNYENSAFIKFQPLASFLSRLVNLEKLTAKIWLEEDEKNSMYDRYKCVVGDNYYDNNNDDDDMVPDLPDEDLDVCTNLKDLEIKMTCQPMEIQLVKYLLNHVKALEKMTIFYPSTDFQKLAAIGLQNFQIASSNVTILTVPIPKKHVNPWRR